MVDNITVISIVKEGKEREIKRKQNDQDNSNKYQRKYKGVGAFEDTEHKEEQQETEEKVKKVEYKAGSDGDNSKR